MAKMNQVYGLGAGLIPSLPPPIRFENAPNSNQTNYEIGQIVYTTNPTVFYTYGGDGDWEVGSNSYATTTTAGIVQLSSDVSVDQLSTTLVPYAKAVYDYGQSLVLAGANIATTSTQGIGYVATNIQARDRQANNSGVTAYFVTPSNLTFVLSAPGPIGDTTASTGAFTNFTASGTGNITGAVTFGSTVGITGATTMAALSATSGAFSTTLAVTGASTIAALSATSGSFSTTLSVTGASTIAALSATSGTFSTTLGVTGASTLAAMSATTGTFSSTLGVTGLATLGAVTQVGTANINASGTAATNIGGSTGLITITAGTAGLTAVGAGHTIKLFDDASASTITLGNATAASSLTLASAVVAVNTTVTGTTTLGLAATTGLISIGISTAGQTVAINNAASNTVANVVNILNGATPGADTTLNIMDGAGTAGTQTVNILASGATRAGAINLGTGAAAHVLAIGSATSGSTVNINGGAANNIILSVTGGNYKGKAAITAPAAGYIGEQIRATVAFGAAVTSTTTTVTDVTSISLTTGIWDVSGIVMFTGMTTATLQKASIGTTSATIGTLGDNAIQGVFTSTTAGDFGLSIPSYRISLGSTTTVYLVGSGTYSAGTGALYGRISATRVA